MIRENRPDYQPIFSESAEMSTLGAMILSRSAAEEVLETLKDDDFYSPAHQEIFRSMMAIFSAGRVIDPITLREELIKRSSLERCGGENYILTLADYVPTTANAKYYASIVQDRSTLRKLEMAGQEIVSLAYNPDAEEAGEVVSRAEQKIFDVAKGRLGRSFQGIKELATDFFKDIDEMLERNEPIVGTSSGFIDLDKLLTGMYAGELTIIAARPSMGKTTFVLEIARRVAKAKSGAVAIFSLEMGAVSLVRRMVSMVSGVSSYAMKRVDLGRKHYLEIADACDSLYELPIYIDDTSDISSLEMRGKCRRLKAEHGLSLIVIDYIQLMRGSKKNENRVQELSDIARSLKIMAKELDVPVIALSQLNRGVEARDNKRPQLSDIRESGSIEAEADVVMMIYRDQYYKDRQSPKDADTDHDRVEVAEIIIAKHRNGEIGTVLLGFQPSYVRFLDLEAESQQAYRDQVNSFQSTRKESS